MGKNINGDRPTAFPLEQEKLPFSIPVVEEPRPKIAKLVAMITDRVPAKLKGVKGNDPEYWGLADLVTDEMADVALKMGVRKPKTIGQKEYVASISQNTVTIGVGPAGTGKTYLAVAAAVAACRERKINRIILTRPAVEAGERLGFLPGDLQSKVDTYLRPLYAAL